MARKRNRNTASSELSIENAPSKIDPNVFYGLMLDKEQEIFANAIWSDDIDIIFTNAKAGSGKTVVTAGVANMLVKYGKFDKIIYIMSPYGERKQGWLPGSIEEKSSVYFEPFYQALVTCNVNPYTAIFDETTGSGYITCITDTFLRGQNLDNAVIIIDEAQNFTTSQLKKILTRVGKKSKVVVIGHTQQCDLDEPNMSGFARYIKHFEGQERTAVCKLVNNHRGWISRHADELEE